ncbi:hypothetical protein PR003_g1816 [Phytophthora rubi]|uniref:Uncharacterized protein n=1 Tax=Phytophthora rubi TaxID=129364 RepID=A0A6A4FUN8_9STRA|nr:hypothetical protein PR003_g1816 [Phytophthora rubi]
MSRPGDHPDSSGEQGEGPEATPDPLPKETSPRQQSKRPSTLGGSEGHSKRSSHRAPADLQLRPAARVQDTTGCRSEKNPQNGVLEQAGRLQLAQVRPERYYLAAETRLEDLDEPGVQPPFWGELVPSKVLDAKVLLEESESEQNDESEESVRSDAGKEGPGDDANDADVPTVAEKPSQRRKRPSSHTSVRDQPPAKRSRRDSRSPLAQKEYSQRTAEDKAVVETPGDGVTS